MIIEEIRYNWLYTTESGEEYNTYSTIGNSDVIKIEEHPSAGEGDKWYYDVTFKNGHIERIFNINLVVYGKSEVEKICDEFLKR